MKQERLSLLPLLLLLLLVFVLFDGVPATGVHESYTCDPDCSQSEYGDKVPDPKDCTQYYICLNDHQPTEYPVVCQDGTIFDPTMAECVNGDTCDNICRHPICKLRCEGLSDLVSDPYDCNKFYSCDGEFNLEGPFFCGLDEPYFDGQGCTSDKFMCCEPECTPYCYPGDVQIIDPFNCTKYYICSSEGPPLQENHHTCSPGYTFQPASSKCVENGACMLLCNYTSNTTTTTTTTTTTVTTTTTPSTTTTTTTATPTTDCVVSLVCPGKGKYPMCMSCSQGYFECGVAGYNGVPSLCDDGFLFNTDPSYPFCVLASECPYTPPDSSE